MFSEGAFSLIAELGANTVVSYHALASEPSLQLVNDQLAKQGRLMLPAVRGASLSWHFYDGETSLEAGPLGTSHPSSTEVDFAIADLLLVPAMAVAQNGVRLGKGGGYYDRALQGLRDTPRLRVGRPVIFGVVYDNEVLGVLPREPHDILIHGYISESGHRWLI